MTRTCIQNGCWRGPAPDAFKGKCINLTLNLTLNLAQKLQHAINVLHSDCAVHLVTTDLKITRMWKGFSHKRTISHSFWVYCYSYTHTHLQLQTSSNTSPDQPRLMMQLLCQIQEMSINIPPGFLCVDRGHTGVLKGT